jgi:hypothetical protein
VVECTGSRGEVPGERKPVVRDDDNEDEANEITTMLKMTMMVMIIMMMMMTRFCGITSVSDWILQHASFLYYPVAVQLVCS